MKLCNDRVLSLLTNLIQNTIYQKEKIYSSIFFVLLQNVLIPVDNLWTPRLSISMQIDKKIPFRMNLNVNKLYEQFYCPLHPQPNKNVTLYLRWMYFQLPLDAASLHLKNGWLKNLCTIYRNGDVSLSYNSSTRILHVNVSVQFREDLVVSR